jgi:hypothetical protein
MFCVALETSEAACGGQKFIDRKPNLAARGVENPYICNPSLRGEINFLVVGVAP